MEAIGQIVAQSMKKNVVVNEEEEDVKREQEGEEETSRPKAGTFSIDSLLRSTG